MEKNFNELMIDIRQFVRHTFPLADGEGFLNKALEEIAELKNEVPNGDCSFVTEREIVELADVFICLMGYAARRNIRTHELIDAIAAKHQINRARKWEFNPDSKTYKHTK